MQVTALRKSGKNVPYLNGMQVEWLDRGILASWEARVIAFTTHLSAEIVCCLLNAEYPKNSTAEVCKYGSW